MIMEWIKKQIKIGSLEIENLKYLMNLKPRIVPSIKETSKDYYLIEKCTEISKEDFALENFGKLYCNLLSSLYKIKRKGFTHGIYKYFAPNSLNCLVENQKYIPYLMVEFNEIIKKITIYVPKLANDSMFLSLLNYLRTNIKYIRNWEPQEGYCLLHGDLHIKNIVKRGQGYLLIDYEYLRFGAKELEVANFIVSCLLFFYKRDYVSGKLYQNKYYDNIVKLFLDTDIFQFFFLFHLTLFYITYFLKEDLPSLEIVRKIIELHLNG